MVEEDEEVWTEKQIKMTCGAGETMTGQVLWYSSDEEEDEDQTQNKYTRSHYC